MALRFCLLFEDLSSFCLFFCFFLTRQHNFICFFSLRNRKESDVDFDLFLLVHVCWKMSHSCTDSFVCLLYTKEKGDLFLKQKAKI